MRSRRTMIASGLSALTFAAVLALMPMAGSAFGQSPVPPPTKTAVTTNGLVANFYIPADAHDPLPAVIVIGGSGGGMDARTAWQAGHLAEHGYATLELAYFAAPGLPTFSDLNPLEYFKTAIDWLRAQPGVDPNRIGIVGTSLGGLAALLAASHYPDLKVVVAAVPSSVIWSAFGSSRISMFSLAGQPLPFLPYGFPDYDDGLNALAQHPDAIIPVEKINGPVMVICGKVDFGMAVMPDVRSGHRPLAGPQIPARVSTSGVCGRRAFRVWAACRPREP